MSFGHLVMKLELLFSKCFRFLVDFYWSAVPLALLLLAGKGNNREIDETMQAGGIEVINNTIIWGKNILVLYINENDDLYEFA